MNDDPNPSTLVAFLDRVALETYDQQSPSEPEPPIKTAQPEQRIVVADRGRRDKTA
jgi:hypothetical protein